MESLILTIHVIACIFLVVAVLLQSGHEGMGAIFGGGSTTMFGATGAGGLLSKVTTALAAIFLVTSLTYNILSSDSASSNISQELTKAAESAPAETPAAPEGVDTGAETPAAPVDVSTDATAPTETSAVPEAGDTGAMAPAETPAADANDGGQQ